jgi:hypothetical protein
MRIITEPNSPIYQVARRRTRNGVERVAFDTGAVHADAVS